MGVLPPTLGGIGEPIGAFAGVNRMASLYAVRAYTLRVCSASVVRSGVGTSARDPSSRFSQLPFVGADARPLPLRMKICRPSRLKRAPVGYRPAGMKPETLLRALLLTSMTATALLSATATISFWPSGDNATELGV